MVSNKKAPTDTHAATFGQVPVLVSPLSAAHRSKMLEGDGGATSSGNWMREQWIANLMKKRMAGGANALGGGLPMKQQAPPVQQTSNNAGSAGGRATKSGGRGTSRRTNQRQQQQQRLLQQQQLELQQQQNLLMGTAFGEKDATGLAHPTMFFNDLGCFEIESQSFMHLTPSAHEFSDLLSGPLGSVEGSAIINDCTGNLNRPVLAATTAKPPPKSRSRSKALKKRTNCLALDVNQPKPRTPRRKLNCGNAFEDFDTQYADTSSSQCFSSVGTPSNFSAEMSRMWGGSDLDFAAANTYMDTFLDIPTPKCAEMPRMSSANDDLGQPKLIRTTSIEQEGLSHFFGQATLGGDDGSPSTASLQYSSYDAARHPSTHHIPIQKNHADLNDPYSQAAIGAVDAFFVKMMPSPLGARRNSGQLSTSAPAGSCQFAASGSGVNRLLSSTPRGTTSNAGSSYLRTPRGPNGEYSFDHKNMPEFETLLDEYKFTDIDQELDSFYLDTIESFGGELDLISN